MINIKLQSILREATFSVSFIGVTFFDERGLIARAGSPFAHGSLDGARVCAEQDSNQITILEGCGAFRSSSR